MSRESGTVSHKDRWEQHLAALRSYYNKFGTSSVPSSYVANGKGDEIRLGAWVSYVRSRYRRGKLEPERAKQLEAFWDWQWGPLAPGPKKGPKKWDKRNEEIRRLYKEGNSLSTIGEIYNLSRQRIHQIVKEG